MLLENIIGGDGGAGEGCGGSVAAVELAREGAGGINIKMEGESRSRWRGIEIKCPHEFKKCP